MAREAGIDAEFIVSDVYESVAALKSRRFEVVYTGLGALCWLPDIEGWADVIMALIAPGGTLYLAEFHPFSDVLADEDFKVEHSYFREGDEPQRVEAQRIGHHLGALGRELAALQEYGHDRNGKHE